MTRQTTDREKIVNEALKEVYLGDGLFCKFDGFQLVLRAPREEGDHYVALDLYVLESFEAHIRYIRKLQCDLDTLEKSLENSASVG